MISSKLAGKRKRVDETGKVAAPQQAGSTADRPSSEATKTAGQAVNPSA